MDDSAATLHFRTTDRVRLIEAIREHVEGQGLVKVREEGVEPRSPETLRLLVLPPRGAWTSIYLERSQVGQSLAAALAAKVQAATLVLVRHDGVAFSYACYDPQGELVDAFHSCPDVSRGIDEDDVSEEELAQTTGDVDALAAALGGVQDPAGLAEALKSVRIDRLRDHDPYDEQADPDAVLVRLAAALGLPDPIPDFDEVRHFIAPEEGLDATLLAYRAPSKASQVRGRVRGLVSRLRERRAGDDAAAAEDRPA